MPAPAAPVFLQPGVLAATLAGLGRPGWAISGSFPRSPAPTAGRALLVYLLSTLLIGLPLMWWPRSHHRPPGARQPISALRQLAPAARPGGWSAWGHGGGLPDPVVLLRGRRLGVCPVAKALAGNLLSADPAQTQASFDALVTTPVQSLLWQWVVLAFIGSILLLGVTRA